MVVIEAEVKRVALSGRSSKRFSCLSPHVGGLHFEILSYMMAKWNSAVSRSLASMVFIEVEDESRVSLDSKFSKLRFVSITWRDAVRKDSTLKQLLVVDRG